MTQKSIRLDFERVDRLNETASFEIKTFKVWVDQLVG